MKSARGDHNAAKQAEANETIAFLRRKYRSFVEVPFRWSLKDMIRYLRDVEPKETMDPTEHPHWNLLLEWHGHCLSTYEKALAQLEHANESSRTSSVTTAPDSSKGYASGRHTLP